MADAAILNPKTLTLKPSPLTHSCALLCLLHPSATCTLLCPTCCLLLLSAPPAYHAALPGPPRTCLWDLLTKLHAPHTARPPPPHTDTAVGDTHTRTWPPTKAPPSRQSMHAHCNAITLADPKHAERLGENWMGLYPKSLNP